MNKKKMNHETTTTAARVSELLTQLAEGLRSGRFVIGRDDARIELRPSPAICVGLKVRSGGSKETLRLDLEWSRAAVPLEIFSGGDIPRPARSDDEAEAASDDAEASADEDDDAETDADETDEDEGEDAEVDAGSDDDEEEEADDDADAEADDAPADNVEPLPLDALSRERLYELARGAEIDGRSSMDKQELVEALTPVISMEDLNPDDREALALSRDGGEEARAAHSS
ncbi:MAG: amphi-Trp domain-containing protein [Nannocystaceae bacterium]